MNPFQWATAPLLLGLSAWHAAKTFRQVGRRKANLARALLWGAAGAMILRPGLTQQMALAVGIGRGADLVLYVALIAGPFAWLAQYRNHRRLENMVTELVRHVAIEGAEVAAPRRSAESHPPAPHLPAHGRGVAGR